MLPKNYLRLMLLLLLSVLSAARADEPEARRDTAEPAERAVRQAIQDYVAALNAGDFEAVASFWTADGDYVDPSGRVFQTRDTIERELSNRFSGPKHPRLDVDVQSVRLVTADVALEDGHAAFTPAGGGRPLRGQYTAVWVHREGKWLLSSLRELKPAQASGREQLAELDWLTGNWRAESRDTVVTAKGRWAPGGHYLLREIRIEHAGEPVHRASQRIGWDPLSRRIKSWTFDDDGGHAEAFWTRLGSDWVAQSSGVNRNGQVTSGKNTYRDIDEDAYQLESTEGRVGSEARPEVKFHFTRVREDAAPEHVQR